MKQEIIDDYKELIECFMTHREDRRPEIHSLDGFYQAFYRLSHLEVCNKVEGDLYHFHQALTPTEQRYVLRQYYLKYFPERTAE